MSYEPYSATAWREDNNSWSATADEIDGAFTADDSLAEVERRAGRSSRSLGRPLSLQL